MKRIVLAVAVLVAWTYVVNTASAAGGTPGSLAANVASAAVGHRPYAPVRVVAPPYRPRVVVAPAVVPAPVVVRAPVVAPGAVYYYGPRYPHYWGSTIYLDTPYVSFGVGY